MTGAAAAMGFSGEAGGAPAAAPAQPSGGEPAASPATPAATPPDWLSGLPDDMKGYVQTKGFKTPVDVLESYRSFEKLHGVPQDRLLKLPEQMDTPEGRAIWEKLGRPKEAKDYVIDIPKESGDPQLADWLRSVADKGNFTQRQVETLVKEWNERSSSTMKMMNETQAIKLTDAENNLKREWGSAFEQNMFLADQGAQALGIDEATVKALGQAMGPDKAMMLLHKFAVSTGEAEFVNGRSASNGVMSSEQAQARINEMTQDKSFQARLRSNDGDAKRQWDNAFKMAYPGEMPL